MWSVLGINFMVQDTQGLSTKRNHARATAFATTFTELSDSTLTAKEQRRSGTYQNAVTWTKAYTLLTLEPHEMSGKQGRHSDVPASTQAQGIKSKNEKCCPIRKPTVSCRDVVE